MYKVLLTEIEINKLTKFMNDFINKKEKDNDFLLLVSVLQKLSHSATEFLE